MSATSLSDADVITRAEAGTLLHDLAEDKSVMARAIALHQAGTLDILSSIDTEPLAALSAPEFFSIQRLFCEAIPALNATVPTMISAVKKLVAKGGQDLAAHFPQQAFRTWLERDLARAKEIVAMSDSGTTVDRSFLFNAVQVLGDLAVAERWANDSNSDRRAAGLAALGSLPPANADEAARLAELLLSFADSGFDDDTRFVAVLGAYGLAEKEPSLARRMAMRITELVAAAPGDAVLLALVRGLSLHDDLFGPDELAAALAVLAEYAVGKPALLHELDPVLAQWVEKGSRDAVIEFLEVVLRHEDHPVNLENFDNLEYHLRQQERDFVFGLAVRWFRTGNPQLCQALAGLIGGAHEVAPFDAALTGFGLSGPEMIVLCHKAIAYMLLTPVLASSFVVAALRVGDTAIENELVRLLAEVILENYGGKARDYLKGIKKGDPAYRAVRKALRTNNAYLEGLDVPEPIKELHPSPSQRTIARQKQVDLGRHIRKQAEAQSALMALMHRSTLLYGHRSLTYVGGKDKKPVLMDLKPFSTGLEMPRLDVIDPVGLDYLMRVFRASKPR